jgi:hypothetical protein
MATITIFLPPDCLLQLQAVAERFQVALEELIRVSLEELLARPDEDFRRALDYVLSKNAELYSQLA